MKKTHNGGHCTGRGTDVIVNEVPKNLDALQAVNGNPSCNVVAYCDITTCCPVCESNAALRERKQLKNEPAMATLQPHSTPYRLVKTAPRPRSLIALYFV